MNNQPVGNNRKWVTIVALVIVGFISLPMAYGLVMGCLRMNITDDAEVVKFQISHVEQINQMRRIPVIGNLLHALQGAGYRAALNAFGVDVQALQRTAQ